MGWLIALGAVAAVVALVIWLPVGLRADYDADGLRAWYTVGPFRVLPVEEKDEETKKISLKQILNEPRKMKKQRSSKKGGQTQAKGGSIDTFWDELKTVLGFYWGLRGKAVLKRLQFKLVMAGDDPCDLAINYGRAWAAAGSLIALLEELLTIRKRDVEVECDFTADQTVILARLDFTIPLGRLLAFLFSYVKQSLDEIETN